MVIILKQAWTRYRFLQGLAISVFPAETAAVRDACVPAVRRVCTTVHPTMSGKHSARGGRR